MSNLRGSKESLHDHSKTNKKINHQLLILNFVIDSEKRSSYIITYIKIYIKMYHFIKFRFQKNFIKKYF